MASCRGCGKQIVWAEDKNGKKIPLDPAPPVYEFTHDQMINKTVCNKLDRAAVSHFATCPNANDFSGSKKQKGLL